MLHGVTLTVPAAAVQLVVGPNGSGKSTLARLAVGLLKPAAGAVLVDGDDPRASLRARRSVGFVAHQSLLYDDLTPLENLRFVARLYGESTAEPVVKAALDRLGVGEERAVPLRRLSRGMVQRVTLARALLHRPRLLVLDEPFTGLDAMSAAALVAILAEECARGVAVMVVTHDLTDVWRLPARVAVLHGGVVAHETDTAQPLEAFRAHYRELVHG